MCERCLINPLCFGEVVPGLYLSKARRQSINVKLGQWVLIESNDAVYKFDFNFHVAVDSVEWEDQVEALWPQMMSYPHDGWRLVNGAVQMGYDLKSNFINWFALRIRHLLVTEEPELFNTPDDPDPFPQLDAVQPHDYSEWVKPTAPEKQ